jgi:hypothetical protein
MLKMFKKIKKLKELEKSFEKYRIRETKETANILKTTLTLKPHSRYKVRVYGENSCGRALSSGGTGASKIITSETIYVRGKFTIWVNDELYDTFLFHKSTSSTETGPTLLREMKIYDFNPKEETEIKIEATKQEGKILCAELFKDIPPELELEGKVLADDLGVFMKKFQKFFKIFLPVMIVISIILIILMFVPIFL